MQDNNISTFFDPQTKKYLGFAGIVSVYDSEIYVDTRNGKGYDKVISKISPFINKISTKFKFFNDSREDTSHDIVVHILEGIHDFDPNRDMKLSTFLEMRVSKRIINSLKSRNKLARNATNLNIVLYKIRCDCGNVYKSNDSQMSCAICGRTSNNTKKFMVSFTEINESSLKQDIRNDLTETPNIENLLIDSEDNSLIKYDIMTSLSDLDIKTKKIINLVCDGFTTVAIAKEVGLSDTGVKYKLKELSKNKKIKDILCGQHE